MDVLGQRLEPARLARPGGQLIRACGATGRMNWPPSLLFDDNHFSKVAVAVERTIGVLCSAGIVAHRDLLQSTFQNLFEDT